MEITCQLIFVPPYYDNFGKRLVKSPTLYFADSGLSCHLLGIENERMLRASPFFGALFEGFVASEIVKRQVNAGRRKELYYFRDQQGLEVDFVAPGAGNRLLLMEAKATRTLRPDMTSSLHALARKGSLRHTIERYVVHDAPARQEPVTHALSPGVTAIAPAELGRLWS